MFPKPRKCTCKLTVWSKLRNQKVLKKTSSRMAAYAPPPPPKKNPQFCQNQSYFSSYESTRTTQCEREIISVRCVAPGCRPYPISLRGRRVVLRDILTPGKRVPMENITFSQTKLINCNQLWTKFYNNDRL